MMNRGLKAIETVYNGYRFRSRLEARWAVFFDALGVPFEYEKEGFDLGEAGWYLPDFWLPEQKMWFEVKGSEPTPDESRKATELAAATGSNVLVYRGPVEPPTIPPIRSVMMKYEGMQTYPLHPHAPLSVDTTVLGERKIGGIGMWIVHGPMVRCYPDYWWSQCPACMEARPTYRGSGYHTNCPLWQKTLRREDLTFTMSTLAIENAYFAARQARFEHGQVGAPSAWK